MKNNKRKRRMLNILNDTAIRMDFATYTILGQKMSYDGLINYLIDILENINKTEDSDNPSFEYFKEKYLGEDINTEKWLRSNK